LQFVVCLLPTLIYEGVPSDYSQVWYNGFSFHGHIYVSRLRLR